MGGCGKRQRLEERGGRKPRVFVGRKGEKLGGSMGKRKFEEMVISCGDTKKSKGKVQIQKGKKGQSKIGPDQDENYGLRRIRGREIGYLEGKHGTIIQLQKKEFKIR